MDPLWVLVLQNLVYINECVNFQYNGMREIMSKLIENRERLQMLCEREDFKRMYELTARSGIFRDVLIAANAKI
jgi:hypothetical protein